MELQDERLGLPSGSSALEDSLCPARWRTQREWVEQVGVIEEEAEEANPDDIDSDAEAGKRIHILYAGQECADALEPERQRAEKATAIDIEQYMKWTSLFEGNDEIPITELREYRWWLYGNNQQKIYSGKTDVVWLRGEIGGEADALVGDLKGLWGHHDSAALNCQIQRYIALIASDLEQFCFTGLRSAYAYLNQPAVTSRPELVLYDRKAIETCVAEMLTEVAGIYNPNGKRIPGPRQCHRCVGKLICKEYQDAQSSLPAAPLIGSIDRIPPSTDELLGKVQALPDARLEQLLPWAKVMESMASMAEVEAKRRLRINEKVFGGRFYLWPNAPRRYIAATQKLFTRLKEKFGATVDEIGAISETSISAVEKLIRRKTNKKGAELEKIVSDTIGDCTSLRPVSSSLKRK